ncbi:MAG: hypothetical protein NT145_00340 [Elusimicrobia bacterium]|nr:hypothetical protein [Elusimicrobiota bacterium]
MSLIAKESGSNFKNVNPGSYTGRCIWVVDIGTQHSEFQGEKLAIRQVVISWELPTEKIFEGEYAGMPYMVSKFYRNSLHEKANLRKDLEAWRGKEFTAEELKGFDLTKVLGAPCMLSVIHNDKGRTKINGVIALPKGIIVPEQINPSIFFDIDKFDQDIFNSLAPWLQKMIMASDEYKYPNQDVDKGDEPPPIEDDSEIPF